MNCKEIRFTRRKDGSDRGVAKNLEISFLLAEIAAHSGITRQGVRDSIKRAEGQLLEYEERLHLAARFRRIENVLSSIVEEAELIEKLNDRFGGAPEIDRSAQSIIRLAKQLDQD